MRTALYRTVTQRDSTGRAGRMVAGASIPKRHAPLGDAAKHPYHSDAFEVNSEHKQGFLVSRY